ncbi:MAG: RNA polymerase sigma factor [Bacteroidetes bacterium]|nr:RNA polymerase sigma factor [Bacteroidota bacterium]
MSNQHQHIGTGTVSGGSDVVLLEQFLRGDDAAFATIYDRFDKNVLTYIRTVVKDVPEVADDLFQETFVRLFRERSRYAAAQNGDGEYKPIQNLRGWLFRVAHNLAISHLRSVRQTVSISDDEESHRWDERLMVPIEESFATLYGETNEVMTEGLYDKLRTCVEMLPQSLREVYVLREINGLEYEDVAATVGCTQEAARMRISRARRALRKALESFLEKEP